MATKYLKLGEKASMFFDPFTQIKVLPGQIIAIDRMPKSKKLAKAMAGGHLIVTTETDYKKYLKGIGKVEEEVPVFVPKEIPKPQEPGDELLGMSREEFVAHVKAQGFQKKDTKAILDIEDSQEAVLKFRAIEKTYEE